MARMSAQAGHIISPSWSLHCPVTHQATWPTCLWELPKGNVPKAVMWEAGHIKSSQSWLKVNPAWL